MNILENVKKVLKSRALVSIWSSQASYYWKSRKFGHETIQSTHMSGITGTGGREQGQGDRPGSDTIDGGIFWDRLGHIPALVALDFYIRAFTKLPYSPISWLAMHFVKRMGTHPIWIDKAPKIFAARVGLLLALIAMAAAFLGWSLTSYIAGSTLVIFAFLECGLNFCAGCWVYTYVVYPLVRRGE
jgi:hypothetical protein